MHNKDIRLITKEASWCWSRLVGSYISASLSSWHVIMVLVCSIKIIYMVLVLILLKGNL